MPPGATIDDVIRLARGLSALDKVRLIERLAPDLEAALMSEADAPDNKSHELDDQYQRGYEQIPEDITELEALLPHLPLPTERWE